MGIEQTADGAALQRALGSNFTVERELGRGGMGIVFLARDVVLDRRVAIKVLPPHLNAQADVRERFLREARTAAQLSHPNIVPIHRADEADGHAYFVMAYIDGEALADRVRDRGPLPYVEAVRHLREVAWALAYAHARGVIHRDIKPENILIERGSGRAVVTDFGIARVDANPRLTQDGYVLGTAAYMSPEQVSGAPLDGRSDLYALGLVGFFALSGRPPFEEDTVPALLVAHATRPAPPLVSLAPAVPRAIGRVIDQCLRKSPDERFASGEALADALGKALEEAEATLPTTPSGAHSMLSEREAAAIWRRAAQLQAEAAQRLEDRARHSPPTAPGDVASPTSGYRVRDVEEAAVEAGISRQFVAVALSELEHAGSVDKVAHVSDWQERAANRLLGSARQTLSVSRTIRGPRRRVLQAIGRVFPTSPFSLTLKESVGPHPLDGGHLVYTVPEMGYTSYAWSYTRYGVYAKELRAMIRGGGDPQRCELELTVDLRPGIKANLLGSGVATTMMAGGGGAVVTAIALKSAALAGALLAFPAIAGAAVAGAAGLVGYGALYRYSLRKTAGELEKLLTAIEVDVRADELFGGPVAPLLSRPTASDERFIPVM